MNRVDLIPAQPGYVLEVKNPRSARAAGEPQFEHFPIIAWAVCFFDRSEDEFSEPFYIDPVFLDPCRSATPHDQAWNSDYDYGAGSGASTLNQNQQADDRFEWRVVRL